jgi:hypothetical protein
VILVHLGFKKHIEIRVPSMSEGPIALIIGTAMIILGAAAAVGIAISIARQKSKDRVFPD